MVGEELIQDMLPTKVQLGRRGIIQDHNNLLCVFYSQEEESLNHLLFHCGVSMKIWQAVNGWLGITSEESNLS